MLDAKKARIDVLRQAKREPLSDADARELLAQVESVTIAKGKSARTIPAREATLDDLRGPTGGFRAPILRVGRRMLVGFHPETLDAFLKGNR